MNPAEQLDRVATTLRTEIGPAVEGEYPRTQAFMAAVVIERIARELRAAAADALAAGLEIRALVADLERAGAFGAERVDRAVAALGDGSHGNEADTQLVALVHALYEDREGLGAGVADDALRRVRATLRARIDRRVEVAR